MRSLLFLVFASTAPAQHVAAWRYYGQDCGGVSLIADGSPTVPSTSTVLWRGTGGRTTFFCESSSPELVPFHGCRALASPARVTIVPPGVDRYLLVIPFDPTLIGLRGSFQVLTATGSSFDGATRVAEFDIGYLKSD